MTLILRQNVVRLGIPWLGLAIVGCYNPVIGRARDAAASPDLIVMDQAVPDLGVSDRPADAAAPYDGTIRDQAMQLDLPDLKPYPDLVPYPDLKSPPDATPWPDLVTDQAGSTGVYVKNTTAVPVGGSIAGNNEQLAAGDFTGDGLDDLAVMVSSGVAVLKNLGSATFSAAALCIVGGTGVTKGLFTSDSALDLAVAGNGGIMLCVNDGTGAFSPQAAISGSGLGFVAAGDFDHALNQDIASSPVAAGSTVSLALSSGNGTYQAPVDHALGQNPFALTTGDFNGDGYADLASIIFDIGVPNLYVLLNQGNGTLSQAVAYSVMGFGYPRNIAAGDFNGDGRADLAVVGGDTSVLLANANGTLQAPTHYATGGLPYGIAVVDFNRDSHLDLAIAACSNGACMLLGNGDGTFKAAAALAPGVTGHSIVAGEFDGDSKIDLAVISASSGSSVTVVLNGTP